MRDDGRPSDKALARYQVISAYLALNPSRGRRGPLLQQLAAKTWTDADGAPMEVKAETIRVWVRRYRRGGLAALDDQPRPQRGIQVLTDEQVRLACDLKREVPERSLDRIIRIMEQMSLVERGVVRRSTLHRVLQREGLSLRHSRVADRQDLDRFEAAAPNDLWQSDMLKGPWLPDPERPGKVRRANLYAFLDDHSRKLLHGRFSFPENLPALELVFRRSLQKYGVPRRVYYDNGATYRARHMRQIVAELGIHPIIFTRTYRPMGHGKIEALNRLIRSAFIAELRASKITTIDALNEAFVAWADIDYNRVPHGETGEPPDQRWRAAVEEVRFADEQKLRLAFLWTEERTPDKAGVFPLFGVEYQAGPSLAKKRVQVRFDPEALDEIEIWHKGRFAERVRPFEVHRHRRPRPPDPPAPEPDAAPTADWLGHLVEQRRKQAFIEPDPRKLAQDAAEHRRVADLAIIEILQDRLEPAVVDGTIVREFLDRYGPFDPDRATEVLDRLLARGPNDHHVHVYLDAIRDQLHGETK